MMSPVAQNPEYDESVTPCRLELSLNQEDGSLLTAPLSTVLLSATDGLYTDLFQMAHGEVDVAQDEHGAMSNLAFAQRRHELAWRLAQHSRGLTHVAALTAVAASSPEFAQATRISTKALQHARTAWVQADEAQDALFFFHAQLFPIRQGPHDVYGALDLYKRGQWRDMSTDVKLKMDRYELSEENKWTAKQVTERWHMAVRDKLLRGEVSEMRRKSQQSLWKITLQGGVVKLTHGVPKRNTNKYPIQANLTVLSTALHAEWTLLSIEVEALPKTGESNHQLDMTNRQRYDLHRLSALAMSKEESRARQEDGCIAKPLHCLFQVAHSFHLSWQLEILSAQAQALKRGVWATADSTLHVTPVMFFAEGPTLGVVSISFWNVEDRYGPPRVGDLEPTEKLHVNGYKPAVMEQVTGKFTLLIRAGIDVGMRVSVSGGCAIMEATKTDSRTRGTVQKLLAAASDPFALSASDVLLAATTLCGERKCHAIVQVLKPGMLPPWMRLTVELGSIAVAAQIVFGTQQEQPTPFVVLFRLECDARTGTFVFTFPRSTHLLRMLSCNHASASETMSLRMAKVAQHRRKGAAAASTGRFVRDSFEGLVRSMNLLGQRMGVGGEWIDVDEKSASLRERTIQLACADVIVSLATCCGVATVYGMSALSLGVSTGVTAVADMAGGPLESVDGKNLLAAPPVGVILDQRMTQKISTSNDGEKKKQSILERDVFAVSCAVTDDAVVLYGFDVRVQLDSPASMPNRLHALPVQLKSLATLEENGDRPSKRPRLQTNGDVLPGTSDLSEEVGTLARIFSNTLDL